MTLPFQASRKSKIYFLNVNKDYLPSESKSEGRNWELIKNLISPQNEKSRI